MGKIVRFPDMHGLIFITAMTALAAAVIFSAQGAAEARVIDEHIYLIPAGNADTEVVKAIKERLTEYLPMRTKVGIEPRQAMPESAYTASRRQYLADEALSEISQKINLDKGVESALIITDVDLYSPDLNFVFGLADKSKVTGIISLARLRNEFYGLKPDNNRFLDRAVKEAVHELGHAWALSHCGNRRCVMYFSNSLEDTDKKAGTFCAECRDALQKRYGSALLKWKIRDLL